MIQRISLFKCYPISSIMLKYPLQGLFSLNYFIGCKKKFSNFFLNFINSIFKFSFINFRYFMTIGAFFGLFAATFVALIPASRLILSMANDNLLPSVYFSRITKKSCIPYNAVISAGIMAILLLFIRKNSLIDIAALNLPIRFVLMVSSVSLL